jgi:single-strand DNA-binding protein
MPSFNRATIIGHLGSDPEIRQTASGKSVGNFNVATSFKSGDKETTTWHRIVVWEKLADLAGKYLEKGSAVMIEGRIDNRSYDDKDGNTKYITEIIANNMIFLGSKPKPEEQKEPEINDLPF